MKRNTELLIGGAVLAYLGVGYLKWSKAQTAAAATDVATQVNLQLATRNPSLQVAPTVVSKSLILSWPLHLSG